MKTRTEKTGTYSYPLLKDTFHYLLMYRSSKRKGSKEAVRIWSSLYLVNRDWIRVEGHSWENKWLLGRSSGEREHLWKNK